MAKQPKPSAAYLKEKPEQPLNWDALDSYLAAAPVAAAAKPESPGMLRSLGDSALAAGSGLVTGAKLVSDAFGADNPVSRTLGDLGGGMQGLLSDARKAELQNRAKLIKEAEDSGSTLKEVGAYLGGFAEAPVDTLLNVAGTAAPTMAAMLLPGAREATAARLLGVGVGAVQGAGAGKASIYDAVLRQKMEEGMPEEQARAIANEAQAYAGKNADTIAANAVLGAVAGGSGLESAARAMRYGKAAAQTVPGMARRVATGALIEGVPEAGQGGLEQASANIAMQREGYDVPTMRGVAGSAALEGAAGGALGAGFAIPTPADIPAPAPAPAPIVPESGPLTRAANAGAPVAAKLQAEAATSQALARMAALADEEGAAPAIDTPPASPAGAYLATPKPTPEQEAAAEQALEAERAQNEIARTSRTRPVPSAQDQEQTALANIAKLPSLPLEDAQRIYAESAKQGKDMALVQHPDGDYTVAPRRWVTQDMAKQGQEQAKAEAEKLASDARKAEIEAAPVERAPRRRTDAVELDPVELAIGAIEKEATPAARAFVQEYRAGRVSADDVMARGKPADPVAALGNIKPATEPGGLILTASGLPFKNKRAATLARDRQENPADFEVKPVEGGFVVQPATPATEASANVAEQQPGNDAGSGVADGAAVSGNLGVVQQPDAAGVDAARAAGRADAGKPAGESGRGSGDDALSARWDALPEADRTPVLLAAGWHQGSAATQRMGKIKWAKMSDSQRARVGQALEASNAAAPQSTPEAQAGQAAEARGTEPAAEAGARVSGARGAEVEADGVTGKKIDDEWTAFARESGTKAIPRAQMPQIKAEHRGAMVQFLKGRGIEHEQDAEVDPQSLKPTQAEFSPAKVEQAKGYEGGDRSILVSADGHVLDGHHQWMAKRQAGAPVKVIRLNAPIDQLIEAVKDFPSAAVAEGATKQSAKKADPDAEAKAKAQADLDDALADLGDIFGKSARLNMLPEQEQKLLPVLTRVLDAAFRLGHYKFKAAARFALQTIRAKLGAEVADQLTLDHLQGAYIGMAGKYQDKGADTKRAVIDVESLAELEGDAEPQMAQNQNTQEVTNDPAASRTAPAVDQPLVEGPTPDAPRRGAKQPRQRTGRGNDSSVRGSGGLFEGDPDGQPAVGDGGKPDAVPAGANGDLAGGVPGVSTRDYRPAPGSLKRDGSWFATAARNVDLIELARRIDAEGRQATPEEQAQLAKYVGFGASEIRNNLFPVPSQWQRQQDPKRLIWPELVREARWKPLAERMAALPEDWQRSVLQSTQYAHYTSEGVIRSVWSGLQRLGFTGGKVLEPGMGIGSFNMLMPDAVHATSNYTGVEFDGPTALIARLLSPDQHMLHDDFIKRKFPRDFFDVAVGNPPFSQTKILGDPDYEKQGFMLHDFFFAKSLDRVRPGGLLVFVTSKGTMDKQSDKARKYLAERADLLGAIRLPSTAFEDNAGTSVVTDVLFLRKRAPGQAPSGPAWQGVQTIDTKDGAVVVNEYFAANPDMVLGEQRISGNVDDFGRRINSNGMGGAKYTVVSYDSTPEQLDERFAKAIERLPENVYSPLSANSDQVKRETAKVDFDPSIKREGVVYLGDDGQLRRVQSGVGVALADGVKLSAKDEAWFKGYVGVRDMVQAARLAQAQDGNWEAALKSLNKAYDAFRKEHGPINDFRTQTRKSIDEDGNEVTSEIRIFKNRRLFREDYDSAVMTQLEVINEAGEIVKAPFLLGRTIGKPVTRTVKTVGDALAVSLDETGRLDLDDIARRMSLPRDEVIDALGNQVFKSPGGQWQLADEYLSGDVVAKLEEAELAARIDPSLKRNIEALKAVQPEKLGPSQISVKAGASWVPVEYVNEFAKEIGAGLVTFDPKTESWQVQGGNERKGRRAGAEYGTADRSAAELLESVLNSQSITIKRTDADKKTYTDTAATTAANEMARKIKDKFKGWIWTDTDRASNLVEIYNKRFNNIAPRRFDGSHMTLPGVSLRFSLHPHQKRAIWRQVQTGNTYLAHAVGAGKTIEMIAGGMEQKRLGLISKPIYAVPNHMLEQFANEFMELYPLANIMVADDENFSAERRKAFVAAATLNAPDAIVITHSAFERIGVKEETVAPIRDEILDDLHAELDDSDKGDRVRRAQLQQQIEAVEQRFDSIAGVGKKDSTIKFEDIGADFIYVDEAHAFRKLDFTTNQKIKGIDPNGSRRALDMYVKSRHLERQRPGRSMVFASGTPVTNTMGELYTIMRFFAPDELSRAGISTFDAWARQFGEAVPALEANAAGRYEVVERFAKFDNVPELMSRVRQFMDVLTSEHLGALVKRPDIEGGKPDLITVDATDQLKSYMKGVLLPRLEASRKWKPSKDQPFNPDPVIAITSDGRFAALDPRFVGEKIDEDQTPTKLTRMADEVARIYEASAGNEYLDKQGKPESVKGSTQIVFYNLGFGEQSMRNRGFDARGALTKRLIAKGVKREHILWFDDADTDAKKETMFKAMRNGQARVLIGSAKKMGTGVNVQKRLLALHYFDPPWYPSDVEQPHGRIIRQGNQNTLATIKWYATKGTYDATMWQMVARKQRFIDQAFSGDKSLRSMDDMSEASMFEQAAAVASGDPRALQLAGLRQDVERLERLQAAHHSEQIAVRSGLKGAEWNIESYTKRISTYSEAFKAIGGGYYGFTTAKVGSKQFDKLGEFGQALKDAFNKGAADAVMAPDAKARELATLPPGITVRMEAGEDREGKPTGAHELVLRAGAMDIPLTEYTPTLGEKVDPVGLGRRVVNAINGIEAELNRAKTAKAAEETDATRLRKKLGAPFEYQQELAEKIGELKRLEDELRAEGEAEAAAAAAEVSIDETGAAGSDPADAAAKFSRAKRAPAGVTLRDARAAADLIRRELPNAPEIVVVDSLADVPSELQNEIRNRAAEFDWEAVYHTDRKIYVMAPHFDSLDRFMFVVSRHEVRHAGLDAMLGERKDEVMLSIGRANRRVMMEARKLMADGLAGSFTEGVEEALADMPVEEVAALSRIKILTAAIRRWLRATAYKLRKAGWNRLADSIEPRKWTDNDVIAFVLKAENVSRAPVGKAGAAQFSRARTILNDEGRPEFVYGDTKLAFPIPTERLEVIPSPGQSVMQYAIMPTEGFDVLGHVDLLLENGRPVSLLDIEAYSRRKGAGRQVIETLLRAFPDSDLNISNIVPEAQGFWEKMGVPVQNLEEGAAYDGTLNLETFLQAQDGGRAKANPRRAGEAYRRPDAGAARRASEANQGWQVASRFSRPRALQTLRDAGARQAEAVRDASLFAGYKVGDFIESTGKLSWWDKSIGTPFNLAKRHPGTFGRVFNAVQDFLSDVSFYATESANLAPRLLPKLETLKDLTKQAISPEDNKAIAAPIFEGTLTWTRDRAGKPVTMEQAEAAAEKLSAEEKAQELLKSNLLDPKVLRMWQGLPQEQYEAAVSSRYANQLLRPGVVWTDAELRSKFSLTDAQIELYKEFRASVDRSLDDLTVSEIARLVRSDLPGARQKEGQSADDFAMEVRDALFEIGEDKTADKVVLMASRLRDLKAKGYAPLSRFGHFTLDVVDADGERAYFGMFESQAEANRMARKMAQQFPGATITQGTQSTEAYKMLAGVSPETIELFGEILGLDMAGDSASDQAFQEYLRRAKSTRSAMKRLIHRKGIAGFSEEVGRVLAGFVTSNARRTSSNHHLKGIMEAVEAMPKEQGELKDYAAKMAEYVNNPVEEAQALRGLMFAQYLGGSVASALVNMTQPIAVTLPFLSQHTTAAKAAKAVTQAMADMAGRKKLESGLAEAMKLAEDKGIVAPQEIHYLQAQARGAGALVSGDGTRAGDVVARTQNGLSKLAVAWGKLFGFAELVNRRATFIAAYRVAVDKGLKDPFKFAADAVEETQFVYNKGNRPQWARGAIGATLFTFKTYSISYIELLSRMWKQGGPEGKKAFALALAVMVLMSGVDELPFMEDAEDLVDGFAQKVLGLNWQTKTQRQEFMANVLGKDLADFLGKGISGVPGVPIDVSGRLGMGNLIPGTGLLRGDSQSMGRDVAEIAGPVADLIKRGGSAVGMAAQGDIGKAVLEASPVAVRNVAKAADMGEMGMYRDATGKKVVDTTMGEAVLKGIGFQPNTVAKVQEASLTKQRMIALNKSVESEIADQWALGRFENDPAKVEAARNRLKAWNRDNPDSPIRIEANQIQKRVKAMRASKQERIEKTAPKELRAAVRRELVE